MYKANDKPIVRWPLNVDKHLHQGQQYLVLSCPLGIVETPVVVNALLSPVLAEFNGKISNQEILEKFKTQGLQESVLKELVELLDDNYCLLNDKFKEHFEKIKKEFRESSIRESSHKGIGFSNNFSELQNEIEEYINKGASESTKNGELVSLIAPHIDYRRGGVSYGKAYRNLKNQNHDLYILIGTAHQYSPNMFHLTKKDFVSPLGRLNCDNELVEKIAKNHGETRSFEDEFLHKREHSLELQLPFMHHFQNKSTFIPILVGGMYELLNKEISPQDHEEYKSFKDALTLALKENCLDQNKSICFIAGVDMAHVGRTFGDKNSLTNDFLDKIRERDEIYLKHALNQNKDKLFSHIAEDKDARRICGYPTLYMMLDVLEGLGLTNLESSLFDYSQAVDFNTDCAVTFAGAGLYKN